MSDLAALKATTAAIEAAFAANPSPSLRDPREMGWTGHEFDAILLGSGIRCPDCAGPIVVEGVNVTQSGSLAPRYLAGRWECIAGPTGRTA